VPWHLRLLSAAPQMAGEGGRWPSRPPGGWLLLASASAVTAACYLAIRRPRHDASTTQFDLFLKTPPAPAHQQAAAGSKRVAVTQFAAFLKSTPAEPDSCDFSSFLKSASNATGTHGDAQPEAPPAEEVPLDRARVLVVFGTEYGFSKEIAEKLCAQLKEGSKCW
jgi:sulfite reductase (NADPH) flavoprotein alpha-component